MPAARSCPPAEDHACGVAVPPTLETFSFFHRISTLGSVILLRGNPVTDEHVDTLRGFGAERTHSGIAACIHYRSPPRP